MAEEKPIEVWDLWFPQGAATGLSFARCRVDAAEVVLVHAAPPVLEVYVRDDQGNLLAHGKELKSNGDTPITRLTRRNGQVEREDIWPTPRDLETLVLLPGGEAGFLKHWWHAEDHSEWRWQVEFYNCRFS